jgi:hypothetical protein
MKNLTAITEKIKFYAMNLVAYAIVSAQSFIMRIKVFGKSPKVHFEQSYQGQKILLLALYQKGRLRPDIENLLITAKQLGMYVLAINTLKVLEPNNLKEKIDCYIERPNFGRDFGSYKTGFLHLFKKGWEKQCPRLLMLNDSIFYSKQNLAAFLNQMTNTDIEVLGATENHEIEHHLGSFCISLQASILQHSRFKNYWKHYTNTDIRSKVIKRGEVKLSKTLRRCVSSADQLQACYDLNWLSNYLDNNKELLDRVSDLYRVGNITLWGRSSLKAVSKRIYNKYLQMDYNLANIDSKLSYFVDNPKQLIKAIETCTKETNLQSLTQRVYEEVKNDLMEYFTASSQIHLNNILLHHLGMPIIKLDVLYRGVFSTEDVVQLASQLSQNEKPSFQKLIFDKPFGGNTLRGWKRAAFYLGLI